MSDDDVASTRAASLASLDSGAAGAAAVVADEDEGRDGIERSTSGVPNEMTSSATLFFLSFLPSCGRGSERERVSEPARVERCDGRARRTLTSAAWLSLSGLPAKTTMRCRWFLFWRCLSASCGRRAEESAPLAHDDAGEDEATHLSDLNAGHEVGLAARLDVVESGHDLALVLGERDEDLGPAERWGGGRGQHLIASGPAQVVRVLLCQLEMLVGAAQSPQNELRELAQARASSSSSSRSNDGRTLLGLVARLARVLRGSGAR